MVSVESMEERFILLEIVAPYPIGGGGGLLSL